MLARRLLFATAPAAHAARRTLTTTSTIAMGHGSHASDNNPEVLEREKQRNLTGQTPEMVPGAPGWNANLASDSEAAVKAERAPSLPMEELQEQTIKMVQHMHHGADHPSPDEGVHNPSEESPAIRDNLKESEEKLKDAHQPL